MRVLITGAAGFLGRNVTQALLSHGFEVTGFDQSANPGIETGWVRGDLLDLDSLKQAVRGKDAVIHLGAVGDVYKAAEQPSVAAEVNVVGSANVAEAAIAAGARVVYASTWEVYGKPRYEPIDEDHPCRPDHPYNITKLAGERLLLAAGELRGLPVIALRLGTAYGQHLRPNSVFRIFIDKAKRGEPITIQGDGLQGRQFTHASDIARAILLATQSQLHCGVFNTVAQRITTIKELAELVVERYPTDLQVGEPRPGDVPSALVSADRIGRELGWHAEMDFAQGLADLF